MSQKSIDTNNSDGLIQNEELAKIVEMIEAGYWVPILKTPFQSLDEICKDIDDDCKELSTPFKSFRANLKAAEKILLLPYTLLFPMVMNDSHIIQNAPKNVKNVVESQEGVVEFVTMVLNKSSPKLLEKKNELNYIMYQAIIILWSAFETFCKDVFVLSLNQKPELYTNLQSNQEMRDRFNISNTGWQKLLEQHKFNLGGKLGTILAANRDFSSPKLLQEVFCCMFKDELFIPEDLRAILNYFKGEEIWILGQRRHLIAHRCGIVDQDYLDKTKDCQQVLGEPLNLRGRDIATGMGAVAQCGISLYANARLCWGDPDDFE